jgi:hypothetical protein
MADPLNPITPSIVAPERFSMLRRERVEKNRQERDNKKNGAPRAFPAPLETENTSSDKPGEHKESEQYKAKGKILDINA